MKRDPETVRQVMTRNPVTVAPDTSVGELKTLFERHGYNAFPVVDEDNFIRGIVSQYDLLAMFRTGRPPILELATVWARQVKDIMRRGVISVEPDDPIDEVVDLLLESRLRSVPVTVWRSGRGQQLVGMVGRRDLLRALILDGDTARRPMSA